MLVLPIESTASWAGLQSVGGLPELSVEPSFGSPIQNFKNSNSKKLVTWLKNRRKISEIKLEYKRISGGRHFKGVVVSVGSKTQSFGDILPKFCNISNLESNYVNRDVKVSHKALNMFPSVNNS